MQETVKKRAWVKDAAIIFLAVMLVLTFFSNTFLNRSLPEVASAYVQSGSIDSKVRITGTVTAKDNYDVVLEQSRKVDSVLVRVGQEVSAGHKFNAGDVLVSIQIPDRGYTITSTVTNEQARLLHVGDAAEVSNYYWGSSTKVELVSMVPDPKSPQSGKLCTFDVSGNVSAGSQLNFAIGAKNASYDYVVPNSAVRSDTNGSFVLVITAKNSPLGNRYYASRVDVEVIASDDMNSALKGALNNMDSVITTASKNTPVAPGDQVRLPDVN